MQESVSVSTVELPAEEVRELALATIRSIERRREEMRATDIHRMWHKWDSSPWVRFRRWIGMPPRVPTNQELLAWLPWYEQAERSIAYGKQEAVARDLLAAAERAPRVQVSVRDLRLIGG